MINDTFAQILEEIKQQKSHGLEIQDIKENLSRQGYSAEVIQAAILSSESTIAKKKFTVADAFSLLLSVIIIALGFLRIGSPRTFTMGILLLVLGFVGLGFKIYRLITGKAKSI